MKKISLTKELEEFLIKGNLSRSPYWDQQIKFLCITLFFISIQFFVSKIVPCVCVLGVGLALLHCWKNEHEMYGNVYNAFIQMMIWSIIWWIDGWCACSLFLDKWSLVIACLIGTIIYIFLLLWRLFIVKKRIVLNWYKKIPYTAANVTGVMSFVFSFGMFLRLVVVNIQYEIEIVFAMLAGLFFLMTFLLIFTVDLGVRYYYFSLLSEEEKKYIVSKRL